MQPWVIQLLFAFGFAAFFISIWLFAGLYSASPGLLEYAKASLPALALTNAISLLGATAFISRYSTLDRVSDVFAQLSDLFRKNYLRLDPHPRESKLQRRRFNRWLFSRFNNSTFSISNTNEPLFTLRPYWDGAWFYGSDQYFGKKHDKLLSFISFHELIICSLTSLRFVLLLDKRRLRLIGVKATGTQGSNWFLDSFEKNKSLLDERDSQYSFDEAVTIIELAQLSIYFMLEEFNKHQQEVLWEEYKEIAFLEVSINYFIWINYVQGKLFRLRAANALERLGKPSADFLSLKSKLQEGASFKEDLFKARQYVVPRKAVAKRLYDIRLGSITTMCISGIALLFFITTGPIIFGFAGEQLLAMLSYSIIGAAMLSNILYGLWLLKPSRVVSDAAPLP